MNDISKDCYDFMLRVNSIYSDLLHFYCTGERFDYERELIGWDTERASPHCVYVWRKAYRHTIKHLAASIAGLLAQLSKIMDAEYMKETIGDPQSQEDNKETIETTHGEVE